MDKKQLCPVCKKPVVGNHPNANVYHVRCAIKEVRKGEGYRLSQKAKEKVLDTHEEG